MEGRLRMQSEGTISHRVAGPEVLRSSASLSGSVRTLGCLHVVRAPDFRSGQTTCRYLGNLRPEVCQRLSFLPPRPFHYFSHANVLDCPLLHSIITVKRPDKELYLNYLLIPTHLGTFDTDAASPMTRQLRIIDV